jgi:molybdopterin adenylyltransferase
MFRISLITVSDTRSAEDDLSGDRLAVLAGEIGDVVGRLIVRDEREEIAKALQAGCDGGEVDLILTTGGTGVAPRDVTPEATLDVIEREVPGIAEHMRRVTSEMHPYASLSRSVAGIRGRTLIVNLPGSTKGVEQCFNAIREILPHALKLLRGESDGH